MCLSYFEQYRNLILRQRIGERRGVACNCPALYSSRFLKCPRGARSPYCREFRGFPQWFHTIVGTQTDNRKTPLPSAEFNSLKPKIKLWKTPSRQVDLATKFLRCRLIFVDTLYITCSLSPFLAPEVLKLLLDFWKICDLHYVKDSVYTPQRTHCASVRKTSQLNLCKENISVWRIRPNP